MWKNKVRAEVIHGDCLNEMASIEANTVRLAYLDPPFFSQKTHALTTRDRKKTYAFDDRWNSQKDYADFIYQRLKEVQRVLTNDGSVFFHCDQSASHIARLVLDSVFGAENFRSEIIWHYRRWSNSKKGLLSAHQTLFYYTKSSEYIFNPIYESYSPATNIDQILQQRERDNSGKSIYARNAAGELIPSEAKRGVPLSDVWDIPYLNPKATERVGYPTQKPILLLERVIRLASQPGDTVLDPFCGSGTTLVAAALLERPSIGIDISKEATALTRERLLNPVKTHSALLDKGRESYRQVDASAMAALQGINCVPVQRNKGIDAILVENFRGYPVPIRVQRANETIAEAANMLYNAGRSKQAALMLLVITQSEPEFTELPPNVEAILSVNAQLGRLIGKVEVTSGQTRLF